MRELELAATIDKYVTHSVKYPHVRWRHFTVHPKPILIFFLSTCLFSVHVLVTIQYTNTWSRVKIAKKDQDVTLPCSVKAFPIPNMAWKKDGELVTNDSRHVITRTELKILQFSTVDMGRFYCIA